MYINDRDKLIHLLEEIKAKIKLFENGSTPVFELVEYNTLKSFHEYNLCFKNFIQKFDPNSVSQLLLFIKVVNTHADLSKKYEKLFRTQLDYLKKVIDFEHACVKTLPPVIFCEDRYSDILDVYNSSCKKTIADDGKLLYYIELDKDYHSEEIDGKEVPVNFYRFRSDNINKYHFDSLFCMYKSLLYIFDLVCAVCAYPSDLIRDIVLDKENLLNSLEKESRQYARETGKNAERDLRKIAQKLKTSRNTSLTPDLWGKVMEEEDELFDLAISGCLDENRLKYIPATKEQLINNFSLLDKIKSTCLDEELFDIRLSVETHNLLNSLNADNLELFYELILRRNIIQREMFPEKLKSKYEEWSNPSEERLSKDSEDKGLTKARQSKLDEIIGILQKGAWKVPATTENVTKMLKTIFGGDVSLLEDGDDQFCEKMWAFVESGSGNRMEVVPANLAGFFYEQNLLNGSPKSISEDIFGKGINQSNNINKGYSSRRSNAFKNVIPFITKYTDKIIRQA